MGITLYHAHISFTGAYRRLFVDHNSEGVQAQVIMLAVATLLFAPFLAEGSFQGQQLVGAIAPVGGSVVAGALLFGIGMQLAGGCGSGTLLTAGAGEVKMVIVLIMFCIGSFIASLHMTWWQGFDWRPATQLTVELGWPLAIGAQLLIFTSLWLALRKWMPVSNNKPNSSSIKPASSSTWQQVISGPWPLVWGALFLALLNLATLLIAGHPWTITWAFSLWGAKLAALLGWAPDSSTFWSAPFQQHALNSALFSDITSVMNVGILIGAFMASALARKQYQFRLHLKPVMAAVLGGLLLGYGARIAYGCNIGAFFSGVASTSLHGWLWILAALPGNWLGIHLRPIFGLHN